MEHLIKEVVRFTEHAADGGDFTSSAIREIWNLIDDSGRNLNVYRGILTLLHFSKFAEFPDTTVEHLATDETFLKCLSLSKGDASLSPEEVGRMFSNILELPGENARDRDILAGCFYGSLWSLMNDPANLDQATEYGLAILGAAFTLDHLSIRQKLKLPENKAKVITLSGSGKKEIKLLNISSMAAIVIAATGRKIGENIVVEKTVARATSSTTGSSDIFELAGVNLNLPVEEMAEISLATKIGLFDINAIVPQLNHVYDGRLHNVQVFAGLVGGAAIVNPVDADLINYGLTRGSTRLCLAILRDLYPGKNILVLQGKDAHGTPVMDQVSTTGDTELAQIIDGKATVRQIAPKDFGFAFRSSESIETTGNQKDNLDQFIRILLGRGDKELEQAVAMEAALNLFGIEVVDDLRAGAELALATIDSGAGIDVLRDLVVYSGGDLQKFNGLVNRNATVSDRMARAI